jgi:hypothetical protein
MGTQQILLIVLSVIIVGIAVAVGITMFNAQSINSARQAIISDMNNFASQAQSYWKTPVPMGGAGYNPGAALNAAALKAALENYIGPSFFVSPGNDNAIYTLAITAAGALTITCVPKEGGLNVAGKRPQGDIDLAATNPQLAITYPTGS